MNEPDLSEFDFDLPESRIALRPCEPRDACKLLYVRGNGHSDREFRDILDILRPGDLLVGNDTRVIPALLFGTRKARDEASNDVDAQVNLLERLASGNWRCLCKPGRRIKPGDVIDFRGALTGHVINKNDDGSIEIQFAEDEAEFWAGLDKIGSMPIPPYIAKQRTPDGQDGEDYQTVFADEPGSVAAPTAGLHFTDALLAQLKTNGVGFETVTLHVGAGTFAGLTQDNLDRGKLHSEWYQVSANLMRRLQETRENGGRIIAIGTTALRTLESLGELNFSEDQSGTTDIFIRPGYAFQWVDGLITNFHLPRSSLFMLVCALAGTEKMQAAYAHAIENRYRFYSYGDACLLLPGDD